MTPQEIRDAISASPELQALEAVGDHQRIAESLSSGRTKPDPVTKFASLGIAERYPSLNGLPGPLAAELCLQKLEGFAVAAVSSEDTVQKLLGATIQRQMKHLEGAGMALGSPAIASMLAVIVGAGGLTQAESDALTGIAVTDDPVSLAAVSAAINAGG